MIAARCCEYLSVGSVIASVWLVMLLPIVIYFIVSLLSHLDPTMTYSALQVKLSRIDIGNRQLEMSLCKLLAFVLIGLH